MRFSCTIVDWNIYHAVGDWLDQRVKEAGGEYVYRGQAKGPDGRPYGYRYLCMGTDTEVLFVPYPKDNSILIIRGNVREDLVDQLDKLEIAECLRKINVR